MLASNFVDAKMGMPKYSTESQHDSSDEDMRLSPPKDDKSNSLEASTSLTSSI